MEAVALLGWAGSLSAGAALGFQAALRTGRANWHTTWAAALPPLGYAGLLQEISTAHTAAAHLSVAALTAGACRLVFFNV